MRITAVTKLKNAILWEAAKKAGSAAALARKLDVKYQRLCRWLTMRECPSKVDAERWQDLDARLHMVTGHGADEIFPDELRQATRFLRSNKTAEKTRDIEAGHLLGYVEETQERLTLAAPEDDMWLRSAQLGESLQPYMAKLTPRERAVLALRYGLLDGVTKSLDEIGSAMGIVRERVRQIEAKALRRLQGLMTGDAYQKLTGQRLRVPSRRVALPLLEDSAGLSCRLPIGARVRFLYDLVDRRDGRPIEWFGRRGELGTVKVVVPWHGYWVVSDQEYAKAEAEKRQPERFGVLADEVTARKENE